MLTVFLGFSGGGFFPGPTAVAALALCAALVLLVTLAPRPFAGISGGLAAALAMLVAFAAWTLISASWSGASARALLEFDRALAYVLALALFGALAAGRVRLQWAVRCFATSTVVVCASGLITRLAPDIWPIAANIHPERLSYPVTYWNALGLLAALGILASAHLTASEREPRAARVLGAAALPLLAATLLLTFSRASLGLAALGLVIYAVVALPRALSTGLLAAAPPTALTLVLTYRADLLATEAFGSAAAVGQGHDLGIAVLACTAWAAAARAGLLRLDDRLAARPAIVLSRSTKASLAGGLLAVAVVGALVLDAPTRAEAQLDRFVSGNVVDDGDGDTRSRLIDAGNNGRLDHWRVGIEAFADRPVTGHGAGTYQLLWARDRPYAFTVVDGHSLYVEVLGELGVVGLLLIGGTLLALLVAVGRRVRGPARHVQGFVLTAVIVWALHAGVDWDWEMPVTTLWLFALAGLAVGGGRRAAASTPVGAVPGRLTRTVAGIAILVVAVTPAGIAVSQTRLDHAIAAFDRRDCPAAIDSALGSLEALRVRSEPYEVVGYCDLRLGRPHLARQAMRSAVARDPDNWEVHYGLAIARAASGLDPRPQARRALRLNPLEPLARDAVQAFRGDDPRRWRRRAAQARLLIR